MLKNIWLERLFYFTLHYKVLLSTETPIGAFFKEFYFAIKSTFYKNYKK